MWVYEVLNCIPVLNIFLKKDSTHANNWNCLLSSAVTLAKNSNLGGFLYFKHKISGDMDVLEKNGLHIRN